MMLHFINLYNYELTKTSIYDFFDILIYFIVFIAFLISQSYFSAVQRKSELRISSPVHLKLFYLKID